MCIPPDYLLARKLLSKPPKPHIWREPGRWCCARVMNPVQRPGGVRAVLGPVAFGLTPVGAFYEHKYLETRR